MEPERGRRQRTSGDDRPVDGQPVGLGGGDDKERDRVDGRERAGRQHLALHAFLAPALHERTEAGEVPELFSIDGRLGAGGKRLADLGDDDTDLAGRYLHPRVADHRVGGPQLEADAGHEQLGLVAGFARKRDRHVGRVVPRGHALDHEPDLGRADHDDRAEHRVQREGGRERQEGLEQNTHWSCLQRARSLPFNARVRPNSGRISHYLPTFS